MAALFTTLSWALDWIQSISRNVHGCAIVQDPEVHVCMDAWISDRRVYRSVYHSGVAAHPRNDLPKFIQITIFCLFNRPGVAVAVLKSLPLLIN